MHLPLNTKTALATLMLAALLSGCSDSTSTQQFGALQDASASESTTEETTEENITPPEALPTPDNKTVELNNRAHASFELEEAGIAYIFVDNPDEQNFDSWLMSDTEYQDYETARAALPQSADPSHQNYKAQYGIDLSSSMGSQIPVTINLLADNYHIVIDNTDLGGNDTFNDEVISYYFAVSIGLDLVISSEDVE